MGLGEKQRRALRPDAQAFDEIRLITVPRYKQSGMSGDEWRISVKVQFFRKGILRHEENIASNMEIATSFLSYRYAMACDHAKGFFAGEGSFCDQEGCSKQATITYKVKHEFCREGHKTTPTCELIRMFCDEHKTRGDCGLEDADGNYKKST